MKNRIRVQLGRSAKNTFEYEYEANSKEASTEMVNAYLDFYKKYRETHSISARMWNFPIVYINDKPTYKVTPNGRWDVIEKN